MTEDLPKKIPLILENNIHNNDEELILREIFNLIEENQLIKIKEINNEKICKDKITIKSNLKKLNNINDMKNKPKNKYKLKLQKIIMPKKLTN